MSRTGRRLLAAGAMGCVVLVAGWFVARGFESPGQRQARAAPPAARPILVRVVRSALVDEVVARSKVAPRVRTKLAPAILPDGAVITARRQRRGASVNAGDVVAEINGRPLILLPGRFSYYRDIRPWDSGPDVSQLQRGLISAGFSAAGDATGTYGPATQRAVSALYASAGARPQYVTVSMHRASRSKGPARVRLPMVPRSEVVTARHLPAHLTAQLPTGAHPKVGVPVVTLGSGELVAHAGVAESVVARLHRGLRAQLLPDDRRPVNGVVRAIGSTDPKTGLREVTIAGLHNGLPPRLSGRDVLTQIVVHVVRRASLVVPMRAVAHSAAGRDYVTKQGRGPGLVRVEVRVLGTMTGQAAVRPVTADALTDRDRVVVG
jgi:hypothetical protein